MDKDSCKYFNGTQNETCEKNINYRKLVGGSDYGWVRRLPCFTFRPEDKEHQVTCEHFCLPTPEELAARNAEISRIIANWAKVLPLISAMKEEYKGRDVKKIVDCPICGGRLHMAISSFNGHVWGKCETDNCLEWLE